MSTISWCRAAVCAALGVVAFQAQAGHWRPAQDVADVLVDFGPGAWPPAPRVAGNLNDRALQTWVDGGQVRYLDVGADGSRGASTTLPGGVSIGNGAAPQPALGDNDVAAILLWGPGAPNSAAPLYVTVRKPGEAFAAPIQPVPGLLGTEGDLAVACDGSVTLVWTDRSAVYAARLPGTGASAPGLCDGLPVDGPWEAPVRLSDPAYPAASPNFSLNRGGSLVVAWETQAGGDTSRIDVMRRTSAGAWTPRETVAGIGFDPHVAMNDRGDATIAFVDTFFGHAMTARRPRAGQWSVPEAVSLPDNLVVGVQAAAGPQGRFHVYYQTLELFDVWGAWVTNATLDSAWAPSLRLNGDNDDALPKLLAKPRSSIVMLVWQDDESEVVRSAKYVNGRWGPATQIGTKTFHLTGVSAAVGTKTATLAWTRGDLFGPIPFPESAMLQSWR